jgi:hypothetical protein
MSALRTIGTGAELIRDRLLKQAPLHNQKTGMCCAITITRIVGPIFFNSRPNV